MSDEKPPIDLGILGVEDVDSPFTPHDEPRYPETPDTKANDDNKIRFLGKARDSRKEQGKKSPLPPYRKGMFVEPLTKLYTGIGMSLMPFDMVCGTAVIESAERCAIALDDLAKQNHAVRKMLFAITQTSAIGTVLVAHMPILVAIMVHHMSGFKESPAGVMAQMLADSMKEDQSA